MNYLKFRASMKFSRLNKCGLWNADMMLKMINPLLWLLERYKYPYYVVYTNFPGEIVYEDDYQVVVKVDENIVIEDVQDTWSPE